jgi:hypothetical protein
MSFKNSRRALVLSFALLGGIAVSPFLIVPNTYGQNATTGAVTGVVADPSGAVVPGASVKIVDTATNFTQVVTTNEQGHYSAPLLKPSKYEITVNANGLSAQPTTVNVLVGQTASVDLTVSPTGANTTVTVSAQAAELIDTQSPALITTFNEKQMQELPAPGGDITTIAFTAPGVVLNAGGSYGNFSADGLPGTSNLYVLDGFDDEDPFLNLNNSGSSNLTLGQGEIAEAAVVQNGYTAQYGRAAGVILNWTTKSGSNAFHGAANYYYNGDVLNANDWFRNDSGLGREKAVSNEWAANGGGPIIKDKLFFFADYEGLHYVLPASGPATFPTQAFQTAVLARIPTADVPLYQQAFALYNASPSLKAATPITASQDSQLGCGSATNLNISDGSGGTFGTTSPCALYGFGTASATNKEWLLTGRVDWVISDKHKVFGRYKMDRGSQPTYTNFISPTFNTVSIQPEYEGQLNDTYVFNAHLSNQFVFAANWYTAYFGPASLSATLNAFPTYLSFQDGGAGGSAGTGTLGLPYYFPQGRNVTQFQFADDLSWIRGSHTFRFGYNFRRDDVSDYDAQENIQGNYALLMSDFANGTLSSGNSVYGQNFTSNTTAYLALYNLGAYLQDEWQANDRLKLTLGIRFDRTGDPLCNNNCFSLYNGSFPYTNVSTSTPYNQEISVGQSHAFANVQSVNVQPRLGFSYDVTGSGHTVVRGGFGLFSDLYPAGFLDGFIQNFPNLYAASVGSGNIAPATSTGSSPYIAAASYAALEAGFTGGGSSSSIGSSVTGFAAPAFAIGANKIRNPTYAEWNLQIQHQISRSDAVILGYAGNSGYDEFMTNPWVNAYSATPFGNLPTSAPDPNFEDVHEYYNEGHSNYNGASATYKHIDAKGVSVDVTYTFSKALDDISDGGTGEYYNSNSITTQLDPSSSSRLNYSYADYDFRHSLSADYIWDMPFRFHNYAENEALGGWSIAGKTFWRPGQPFTVYNSSIPNSLNASFAAGYWGSNQIVAQVANPAAVGRHCGPSAAVTPCFAATDFASTQTNFGNYPRNSFFGPHYADTDFSLYKKFVSTERFNLQLGANAYNIFNHPNFSLPSGNVQSSLGVISSIAAPPTSPYGSFQSAGVGGRVLQVFGKFTF